MKDIVLIHGMGGSSEGNVLQLQNLLEENVRAHYFRPLAPHNDSELPAEVMWERFRDEVDIPQGSLVVGLSMGGLLALKLQADLRPDLQVIALNAPTHRDDVIATSTTLPHLILYSKNDPVIAGRNDWDRVDPQHSLNLPWLNHFLTGNHKTIASIIKRIAAQDEFPSLAFVTKEVELIMRDNGAV